MRILNLLRDGELCACDLIDVLGVPQAKVSRHLAYLRRAVGFAVNDFALLGGAQTGAIYSMFDGQSVGMNDVLIKYTNFGDADLDGAVTTNDYFQIDNGFLGGKAGWINGDFDYSGSITTNDYFLIDNAFLGQGAALVPAALGSARAPEGVTAVPEPTSLGVFMMAGAVLLRRGRRSSVRKS